MTIPAKQRLTALEYLAFERASEIKHEYIGGALVAMAGASAAHNIIVANIIASLHGQVRDRNCTVFPSDMRLRIIRQDVYTYPDIMIVCGDVSYEDDALDSVTNPTVLIEVLSPTTESYDRGKKSQHYRSIPSLREYLLVAQAEQHIEHFIRYSEHQWLLSELTAEQPTVRLAAIGCDLALEAIYAKVPGF